METSLVMHMYACDCNVASSAVRFCTASQEQKSMFKVIYAAATPNLRDRKAPLNTVSPARITGKTQFDDVPLGAASQQLRVSTVLPASTCSFVHLMFSSALIKSPFGLMRARVGMPCLRSIPCFLNSSASLPGKNPYFFFKPCLRSGAKLQRLNSRRLGAKRWHR